MDGCLFCHIAQGNAHAHTVWEDEDHIAFLSVYPNTKGATVVIPKAHHGSYVFDMPDAALQAFIAATKQVAQLLDAKLETVGRTALVFEGFAIDHAHAKLFPMHGTVMDEWRPIESDIEKYFEVYEGYISSHDGKRAKDAELQELAAHIRGE